VKQAAIYILASHRNGTLYVGVSSDLRKRIWQHRQGVVDGFTREYSVYLLVCYELHQTMLGAIAREKQLKKWRRAWKLRLIESYNLDWIDLYDSII
jgi:putative endonuclease